MCEGRGDQRMKGKGTESGARCKQAASLPYRLRPVSRLSLPPRRLRQLTGHRLELLDGVARTVNTALGLDRVDHVLWWAAGHTHSVQATLLLV